MGGELSKGFIPKKVTENVSQVPHSTVELVIYGFFFGNKLQLIEFRSRLFLRGMFGLELAVQ